MEETKKHTPSALIYIIAWVLFTLLLLADVLMVREATLDVMTAIQQQKTENSAEGELQAVKQQFGFVIEMVDRSILIGGAVIAVMLSLYIEHYLRIGRKEGLLKKRLIKVTGILLAVMVVSVVVQTLI